MLTEIDWNGYPTGVDLPGYQPTLEPNMRQVKEAAPAIPVQVLGLAGVPMAGDQFLVVEDASQAREIAQRRERLDREAKSRRKSPATTLLWRRVSE